MTLILDKLLPAVVYCQAVRCVVCIAKKCSEVFDYSVMMLSITVVLGSHEFGFRIWLEAQGGIQLSTGRGDLQGGCVVLLMLSKGFGIKLSDFEAGNVTLKDDYLWQVVEIVIGGVLTVVEVRFMYLFMCLRRIMLQGSI